MAPPVQTSIVEDVSNNKRKLPGHAKGAYAFAMFEKRRAPQLLDRNIKRVQEFHEEQCQKRKSQNGQASKNARLMAQIQKTASIPVALNTNKLAGPARDKIPVFTDATPEEGAEESHDTSLPLLKAMSRETLLVKDSDKRRASSRLAKLLDGESDKDVLKIDLRNIRKKLNFKDRITDDQRPSKRVRRGAIPCNVHLTIWDNSPGRFDDPPILIRSRVCDIIQDDRKDEGPGRFLELRLDQPWIIPRRDLKVHFRENGMLKSRMADRYFIEFKFVPMEEGPDWPPFNVLGKSDGDQQAKLDEVTKEALHHTLIARQHDLNVEPGKALSLFFFTEGRSMRTKYGLAVETEWVSLESRSKELMVEDEDFEPWMLDDNERPFGKGAKKPQAESIGARDTAVNVNVTTDEVSAVPQEPKIRWIYDPRKSVPEGAKRNYREFMANGTDCYFCAKACHNIENLLFHLERMHDSFNHEIERIEESDGTRIIAIAINDIGKLQPRIRDDVLQKGKSFEWEAPKKPFDIKLHTTGNDKSWLGAHAPPRPKRTATEQRRKEVVEDPRTALRVSNGYLPWQIVPPFRPAGRERKRHPAYPLIHKRPLQATPYSSISHRPLPAQNIDDEMSDSDDEADDAYLADRWSQDLDLHARENSWSDAKRRLYKKWGYYVFYREQSPHPKYISDTLVRFVRQERDWLLRRGPRWPQGEGSNELELESIMALEELLLELVSCKIIDSKVCNEVLTMLETNEDGIPMPPEEMADRVPNEPPVSVMVQEELDLVRQLRETQLTSPASICGVCKGQLDQNSHRVLRCSSTTCKQAERWYHTKCAGIKLVVEPQKLKQGQDMSIPVLEKDFMRRRKIWKCTLCKSK